LRFPWFFLQLLLLSFFCFLLLPNSSAFVKTFAFTVYQTP
jgi:hypothetical protein